MEQVLAWCGWPDSLQLDQSSGVFGMGTARHIGVIAWHCYPRGRGSAVLSPPNDRRMLAGTNPGWMYCAAFK